MRKQNNCIVVYTQNKNRERFVYNHYKNIYNIWAHGCFRWKYIFQPKFQNIWNIGSIWPVRGLPASNDLLKVNNRNSSTRCEICSKLINTVEQCHWHCSSVFIINFEQISHLVLAFLCWHWVGKSSWAVSLKKDLKIVPNPLQVYGK